MVRLGAASKPATVSIGGSGGKTTTTPASKSSTQTAASKLSSLEKAFAGYQQQKAAAPPQPSYTTETQLDFYPKTTTITPVKTPAPSTPTPAQAIQASISSGVNVHISPETLASRNEGLKPLTAPAPTSGLGSKVAQFTGGALGNESALPTPAQAIQRASAASVNVPISPQILASRNEGLKPLTAPASPVQIPLSSAMNRELESLGASGAITLPRISIPAPSQAIPKASSDIIDNVSKKIDNFNKVVSAAIAPPTSLAAGSKIQTALASSLATGNTKSLQSALNSILASSDKVAAQASNIANKKIDAEKASLYSLSSTALNNMVKIANNEFNKANTVKAASDIKSSINKTINDILEIGKSADQVAGLAKVKASDSIIERLNSNRQEADQAIKHATLLNTIKISPGQSQESVTREVYSQLYANSPASPDVLAERMGAINDAIKPYTKNGIVDHTKLSSFKRDLLPVIQAEDWGNITTGDDMEDQRRGIGKYASKSETKSTAATSAKPGTATRTSTNTKIGSAVDNRTGGVFESLDKVLSKDRDEAIKKLYDLGATSTSKTTTSSKPTEGPDFNKLYRTPTGDVLQGSRISKAEFAKGGFTEYTKTVPETAKPATTSTSKPKDAVAVKGSVEGRIVNLDPVIYKELKTTGYNDKQIADSLASGKMGIYVSNDGKVKIAMKSSVPNAAMADSGLFTPETFKVVKDSTGKDVPVNEWAYRKTSYLGLSDKEIGDLGTDLLNRAATLDVGFAKTPETGKIDKILTEAGTVLQVPDIRAANSGMFTLKPRTNAQVPDPLKDPWGYADWVSKKPFMAMMGPGYENGYDVQPTVQGLIQFEKVAKDLAKPGASLDDVPVIGELNQYEIFKNALTYADKETIADIAKNNPRAILGAATDRVMQPVLEAKLGSTEYKNVLDKAMTPDEKEYVKGMEKARDLPTALAYLPTAGPVNNDLRKYSNAATLATGESVITEPLTPFEDVNAALAPIIIFGVSPVRLISKAGKADKIVDLVKASDGTINAIAGKDFVGKVGYSVDDPTKIVLETLDGKVFELSRDGKAATEVTENIKATVTGTKTATADTAKTVTPPAQKAATTGKSTVTGTKTATAADTAKTVTSAAKKTTAAGAIDLTKIPIIDPNAPGIGIGIKSTGGLLEVPTDARAATGIDISRSVTGEPITSGVLAERSPGLNPIVAVAEKPRVLDFGGTRTGTATETKFFDMKKNVITDDGFKPFSVVDPTGNRFTITKVRDTGVMETADGKFLVDIDGKGNYYQVHKDYVPANRTALALDEAGNPMISKISRPGDVDTWQVTYTDDFGNIQNVVTTRPITNTDDALSLAVEWDARLKALPEQYQTVGSHAPSSVADEMLGGPNGYGGEMGDAGPIGGGGGGYIDDATGGNIVSGQDVSQWAYNQNWGAELRSLDNGKTWQVKDPETGNILSTTEYEELVLKRTAERSPKYDAELNTYTKLNKDGSRVYQDSAGNWVSKAELDAERAAIARNNPTYTYGVDETKNNARTRTNSATGDTQYMDPQTGNWLSKDQFEKLMASEETPLWNSDGGYYYFRKDDGTFEILNPYTNVRQTPEEYGKYLSDRLASTAPPTTTTPTITTPTEYTPSYVAPTQSDLSNLYNEMITSLASREGGANAVTDAWSRFTQTPDFGKFAESGDANLLARAKNGEVLTETEIARVQYLRSQMSDTSRSIFDEAMGASPINIMPLSEFQNQITASRDVIKNLSDADIKSSNLGPEKEIIVHQSKAEANMDDFLQFEEFKSAPKADQDVILDEIRYFIGEPTTIPNLLERFNMIKSTWTAKATMAWNKIVEALKSAKELIYKMPASWLDANEDYSMAELILGNSKYSDVLVVTGTKGPTKASLAKSFEKSATEGTTIAGPNGWQAAAHNFKKSEGWVVKSPEGDFQFIRRNEMVPSADKAMDVAATPAKMFYWEKPSNVPTQFKVPENANGSRIVAVNRADPYSVDESVWKGLTESGGLTSDMSKEFVKIDLLTDDGILWSTVREADKAGPFQIGRTVEIVEKDAVRVNGLSGIDLQRMNAREFASLVGDSDIQAVIRAIPEEDIQYLTKYLDETRVKMIEDVRTSAPRTVEAAPPETPTIRTPETAPGPGTVTPEELASEYQKAQKIVDAKTAERMAIEDELSELGRQIQELGVKLETTPVKEKAAIKSQIDGLKTQADALKNKGRRLNQEVYDARNVKQAKGTQIVNGQTTVDDLLNQLDTLSVRDGRAELDEALAKSEDLKTYLRNTSREEAEQLAMRISEKLGSDRSAAEKIMGFHYQGAVGRIDDATRAKMSATDQEYIRRAMTRQLNQNDYQQVTRIVENAGAYQGVSVGADLGRLKIDNILDSSMAGKSDELKKLLTDKDVKAALKDETFADEAVGKVYEIDPNVAAQYQKAAQDSIIADMKADPKYNNLSAGDKKFIDEFYSKRTYTHEDIERLARIRQTMPSSKFSRFLRGGVMGSAGMIKNIITHPMSFAKKAVGTWVLVNGAMFAYFAVEEGLQTMIQMTGWDTPVDAYMEYLDKEGLKAFQGALDMLGPLNFILDNVPGANLLFAGATAFRWYIEGPAIDLASDKVATGARAGLWIPDEGCDFGPGCWGHVRPESERPAYWANHPETMAALDGDTLRRIYDFQDDGSIGPNNLIAKGLGITDPELAKQVGLGHFISASNQGARDTLTKEFGEAYNLIVKGGAITELANQAYIKAKGQTGPTTIDPNAQYILANGTVVYGKDVTDPSQIIGKTNPDGTISSLSTIGSTNPAVTLPGLTAKQRAALMVAPMSIDALTKYENYKGTATSDDAQAWRSIFLKPDGSLDIDKLKSVYPDMTAAQMSAVFPKEAINRTMLNKLSSITDPKELAQAIAEYKASGLIDDSARVEQYMSPEAAAAFTARQNNPANFKTTAYGNTLTWVDDTGYPHTANIIQSGKLFNPVTGQYDIDQKKVTTDGSEFTIDPGKYAEFINSGNKDIAAFLADNENYIQTWRGTGSKSGSSGGGGGGGGYSSGKGSGSYSKSTGETGIFIDTAGLNAEVYENGAAIGLTDEIITVEPGVHTITIKKDGYKPYTLPVQVYNGSIARKSVTLYQDTETAKSRAVRFAEAIGGAEAITPDHIVYAYAVARKNADLENAAKAEATPPITGNWAFVANDVKELIALYREA